MNPMMAMFGQMMRGGGNPQTAIMNMLQNNVGNSPMMQNIMQMVQNQDEKGLEQLARNLAKEKNIDVDQGLQTIRQNMGL